MIRIVIADDHTMLRGGLKMLLDREPSMELVGEASNGSETIQVVKTTRPNVLLLDVTMPGRGGLDIVKELKQQHPDLHILMLTAHPEDHFAIRCLRNGADGYLTKESAVDELVEAILRVQQGGKYISEELAQQLAFNLQVDYRDAPHETLSDREFQVLLMIAAGQTVSEIAVELSLSVKTISTYRGRILEKMQFRNNSQITQYCLREKLI